MSEFITVKARLASGEEITLEEVLRRKAFEGTEFKCSDCDSLVVFRRGQFYCQKCDKLSGPPLH